MRKNFKDVGFYPQPVLIIGTYDADGVPDAMNVGWGGLVGGGYVEINISQGHKTTENLSLKGAFTAVSYTHLDVYKRQVPSCSTTVFPCGDFFAGDP